MDDNTDEFGIPFKKERFAFYKFLNTHKGIEVNENDLENFNKELFSKAIEIGVPGWMALTYIKSHIKSYVKVTKANINEVNSDNLNISSTKSNIYSSNVDENKVSLNNNDELNLFIEDVIKWNNNKDYLLTVKYCEDKEKKIPNLFENITLTNKYLWALYKDGVSIYSLKLRETKIQVLERILKKTNNSDKLNHDTIGLFYLEAGEENNDIRLLKKALQYFQSHNYNDKELGNKRIKRIQELIKLKPLGLSTTLEVQFKNGNYTKLWKVNCFVNEPYYDYKGKLSSWKNSNPTFYIPSNGIITEKGAIAFIKAKWEDIYTYTASSWKKNGKRELDKTKIEIIEINEIVL
jgi:hypothetical protein